MMKRAREMKGCRGESEREEMGRVREEGLQGRDGESVREMLLHA